MAVLTLSKQMQEDSTIELISLCKKRDRNAQRELYQKYSKQMFNLCIRLLNSFEDAEDILQEGFIKMFRNIHQCDNPLAFRAWFKRIIINLCLQKIKQNKQDLLITEDDKIIDISSSQTSEEVEAKVDINQIRKAIQKLPDGFRIVFSLYQIEGYDHEEISEILNISKSTSKSQYHRAKKKLREVLQKEELN